MIVLDTNVISELMRPAPDDGVKAWIAAKAPLDLAITTITVAEIRRGIVRLPNGRKRERLEEKFSAFVEEAFAGRLLVFDQSAAYACGEVSADRERKGLHADAVDMMIAAIVKSAGATLATRNTSDFELCGIGLANPWQSAG
ncbi:MAG: type II toxin-antitoxin system VapC family toxin [Wenzhouxiangella sp.]|jgi:predicted nucleic acid-binding protein|nr:type II toxin-antitoxin system VapC family toxin [Wenzhouxiangella sp.]